jgi:protein involved in polysaccharide export with SLBB domain
VSALAVALAVALPVRAVEARQTRADTTSRARVTVGAATQTATRAQLTAALESAERAAVSGAGRDRDRARDEAAAIRARLRDGDFQVGDRIGLALAGDTVVRELTVREGGLLDFPYGVGPLTITGVLRSELVDAIGAHMRKFVRDPDIRVFPLQRVTVVGAVQRPGLYWVRRDLQLSEVVMRAGGPQGNARLEKATVVRSGREVIGSKAYARLSREGRTVEESGVVAGDEIRIPQRGQRNWAQVASYAFFGISALAALLALVRSSYQ